MFKAYVVIGNSKMTDKIKANPYIMSNYNDELYLEEITKENAEGLVFYLLSELTPEEVYLCKKSITVIGVNGIIKIRSHTHSI